MTNAEVSTPCCQMAEEGEVRPRFFHKYFIEMTYVSVSS